MSHHINQYRLYVFFQKEVSRYQGSKYEVHFKTTGGKFKLSNIRREASVIGVAGIGKTEGVVYGFLEHFSKHSYCGIIHDYKDFEITDMVYPLFQNAKVPLYIISFDRVIHMVNPIAQ